jgi:hypothetical protein
MATRIVSRPSDLSKRTIKEVLAARAEASLFAFTGRTWPNCEAGPVKLLALWRRFRGSHN